MSAACSNTLGRRAIAANAIVAMVWLAALVSGPANALAASPSLAGSLSQIIVTPFVEPTTSINAVSTQFESQFASRLEAAAPGRVAARLSTASPRQAPLEARDVRDLGATESASYVVVGAWLPESGANADPTREALIELRSAHSGATHSRYRFVASGDPAGGDARDAEVDRIAVAMVHDLGAEPESGTLASVATPGPASSSEPSTRKRNDFLSVDGDEPIEISADLLEFDSERSLYTGTGNVLIRQLKRVIRADWEAFNTATGRGVASGNVEIEEKGAVLRASFIEFDVYGVEGLVRDGKLDSTRSGFHGEGRVIRKTGERTYHFEEGRFTTCDCPDDDGPAPWEIVAKEADVEVGGYATVRNSTLDVLGVPVFWLPWMIYPIKTDRQSGVLLPELEIGSRNGFGLGIPIFWAAHDQLNLILTPSYTTRRGGRAT